MPSSPLHEPDRLHRLRLLAALALWGWAGYAAPAYSVPVEVTLVFDGPLATVPVAMTAVADGDDERRVERDVEDLRTPLLFDLEPGRVWRVRAAAPGWWSPEVLVTPTTPAANARVPVFRTGTIRGSARIAPDKTTRRDLRVRFESPEAPAAEEGGLRVPRSTVRCPLEADGRWSCDVPAAKLDLRLSLPERVPVYLWGIEVSAGEARPLGKLAFRIGASIAGWIAAEGAGARTLGTASARVTLRPAAPGDPSTPRAVAREKLAPLEQRTPVDERGFFQFHGVAAGEYEVIATADGFAATRFGPVLVVEGHETVLPEPLVLRPPAEVEIRLDPPVDPWGLPWRIRLAAIDTVEGAAPPAESEVDAAGQWRHALPPGRYQLFVLGRRSDRRLTRTLDVPPEGLALDLTIPVVLVEGLVSLGDDPVPAILWFGGRHGAERVRLEADDEGRFLGVLPRPGTWRVHAQVGEGELEQEIPPVEVETPPPGEAAFVEVRLPDTELTGRVVDSSGRPVPGAEVEATYLTGELTAGAGSTRADDDGEFALRGLPEGPVTVSARLGEGESRQVSLELDEDLATPPVELVLEERRWLTGSVVSPVGPAVGALVIGQPALGGGDFTVVHALTEPDGSFELPVPPGVDRLDLVVVAPGWAVRIVSVPAGLAEPMALRVDEVGGRLRLRTAGGPIVPILVHGGVAITMGLLGPAARAEAADENVETVVERVEPGEYTLCAGFPPAPDRCASGFLHHGGELVLELPR